MKMFSDDNFTDTSSSPFAGETAVFSVTGDLAEMARDLEIDSDSIGLLPLRGNVLFPNVSMPIPIGRESSLTMLNDACRSNSAIIAVAQKDAAVEEPKASDIYRVGVICKILKVITTPDGKQMALLQTFNRAHVDSFRRRKPYIKVSISPRPEVMPPNCDPETDGLISIVVEKFTAMLNTVPEEETNELKFAMKQVVESPTRLLSFIVQNLPLTVAEKQRILEIDDFRERVMAIAKACDKCLQTLQLKMELQKRTHQTISRQQRDAFLQQQIRTLQDELGGTPEEEELDDLERREQKMMWGETPRKHFEKEMRKLERYNPQSPDYAIQYTYLETLLNLPWDKISTEEISIDKAETILNRDHSGLEKVKERILEQLAVLKLRGDMKVPILCLFGPPGVGKTSLGRSVAESLGRDYARISLGGVHDEAEIRGHRRTYIGAMPGRIISSIIKAGTSNPVIVLDEIDKLGSDHRGDPSSALLEVLDPEQNSKFHDNYIDVDYDLSKVLFLATANTLDTIPRPLLDRMEIIEINGYIRAEKITIARDHLVPKLLADHGFKADDVEFDEEAIGFIVDRYTREAGVRQLEKKIGSVLRKIARKLAADKPYEKHIDAAAVRAYLGTEEVDPDQYENNDTPGIVTGLAWTQVGGEILFIESSLAPGKGERLTLTGNLGDVMKESAMLALQYLKANATSLGIDPKAFTENDVHIHVPEGAIPKDGPSAGITMVTSLASSFTGRKVREKIAMTGEITLRGKVLPVGGIKEKILAAKRAGITDILLCKANRKDIDNIDACYLEGLTFHYVDTIGDVLDFALL